jgi:hypothetical protein
MTYPDEKLMPLTDQDLDEIAQAMRDSLSITSMIVREQLLVDRQTGEVFQRKVEYHPLNLSEALAMAHFDTPSRKVFRMIKGGPNPIRDSSQPTTGGSNT